MPGSDPGEAGAGAEVDSEEPAVAPTAHKPAAVPPQHPAPRPYQGDELARLHRHRPASLPERPDATVDQAPDQAPDRAPDQATGRAPDRAPGQAADQAGAQAPGQAGSQAPDQAQDQSAEADPDGSDPAAAGDAVAPDAVTAAPGRPVAAVTIPVVLPARWQDASTTQLPLGVGLGLIGCGLGLIGVKLRKG
ncbi:hypothetical protein [Kitasatospora sp. NPDC085464]|uniref:hypothetical protein n=1 Tax=Kitasatospora sp. NPDC085464 TaxID=3364063 RepID=UPI0037CA5946